MDVMIGQIVRQHGKYCKMRDCKGLWMGIYLGVLVCFKLPGGSRNPSNDQHEFPQPEHINLTKGGKAGYHLYKAQLLGAMPSAADLKATKVLLPLLLIYKQEIDGSVSSRSFQRRAQQCFTDDSFT